MNTTNIGALERPAETQHARPRLLYPSLVIAAISVTLFSLLGIAALTGLMPAALSSPQATATAEPPARVKPAPPTVRAPVAVARATNTAACANCGRIESVTREESPAKPSGVGAIAGGLAGALLGNQFGRGDGRAVMTIAGGAGGAYLGNRIEQNSRRVASYRIAVRMEDGSLRTVHQTEPPNVPVGGAVQLAGNSMVALP